MLLLPQTVVALCESPANASAIAAGRQLEKQHRLHIEGPPDLLGGFLDGYTTMATPKEKQEIKDIAIAATVPKFGAYIEMLGKVFTARGANQYYEFSTPQAQQSFEDYLAEQQIQPRLQEKFAQVSFLGFQGAFLVDLPAQPNAPDELPAPYWEYIPSSQIHDAKLTGNTFDYLILKQSEIVADKPRDYYVCFDDQFAHIVTTGDGGVLDYSNTRSVQHGLGYVPAWPPSLFTAAAASDVTRTSLLHKALHPAKVYLRDYNVHELSKTFHGFQKFWSLGVKCNYQRSVRLLDACEGEALYTTIYCSGSGYLNNLDGSREVCPKCQGEGKIIPVGPDKTYVLEIPAPGEGPVFDVRPPAGYIEPDIETAIEQRAELAEKARELEQAALGQEGVLSRDVSIKTLGEKLLDLQPVYDRCATYGRSWKHVLQHVIDTIARLRYGADFKQSAINIGTKYAIETVGELEARYTAAKAAGYPDSVLFGLLEDIIYIKYADDPMELEYNRLKLYLEPVPTRSTAEVQQWVLAAPTDADLLALFRRKRNLNDYVARFERENGPLVQFGVRQPFAARIDTILETFKEYDNERAAPAVVSNTTSTTAFPAQGQRVEVKPGMAHHMGGMTMGGKGTVELISQEPALGIRLDSMPDEVHKWYTADELQPTNS